MSLSTKKPSAKGLRLTSGRAIGLIGLAAMVVTFAAPATAQQAYFRGEAEQGENVIVNLSVIDRLTGGAGATTPLPTLTRPSAPAAAPTPLPAPAPAPTTRTEMPQSGLTNAGQAASSGLASAPSAVPQSTLEGSQSSSTTSATAAAPRPAAPPPPPNIPDEPEPAETIAASPPPPPPAPEPEVAAAPEPAPAPAPEPAPEPEPEPEQTVVTPPPAPEPEPEAAPTQTASVDLTAVTQTGVMTMDNGLSVLFASDSQDLPPEAQASLQELANQMNADESLTLKLLGYSEPIGDTQSKPRRLSLFRALAVRTFLLKAGIDSRRMTVQALGAKSDDPERPMNRVDLIVGNG